jgi:hypothetical protein
MNFSFVNLPNVFHEAISCKRPRKWIVLSLIFSISLFLSGCATYQRIQASKTPRFETGPAEFKGAQSCKACVLPATARSSLMKG